MTRADWDLLFVVKHKTNSNGSFIVGDLEYGNIEDFLVFFNFDAMIEKTIVASAKSRVSNDLTFEREGRKYLLKIVCDKDNEWNLTYKVFEISVQGETPDGS